MSEDSFILVNLKDTKSKKLAQVISNESSRKILDFLTKGEATETEISNKLSIPISTVHYNLKHLKEANLIQVDEFHYSEKGKEVDHYKLSNKFVIIAPETKKLDTIKQKLKRILPVGIISLATAGAIQIFSKFSQPTTKTSLFAQQSADMLEDSAIEIAPKVAEASATVAETAADTVSALPETITQAPDVVTQVIIPNQNIALWFLLGALFALILYFIIDYLRKK